MSGAGGLNPFRDALLAGECPVETHISCSSVLLAETIAAAGYESTVIDLQHGEADVAETFALLGALRGSGRTTPAVRVPWNDPTIIMKVLDAGAMGVVCPMIDTREQAEAFVGACRYAPAGYRSFGPLRAIAADRDVGVGAANEAIMAIAQVETLTALENIESIVATPGLSGLFPGPTDMSISAGSDVGIVDYEDPRVCERLRRIIDVAHAAGIFVGLPAIRVDWIPIVRDLGVDWIQMGIDWMTMSQAAEDMLAASRAALAAHDTDTTDTAARP